MSIVFLPNFFDFTIELQRIESWEDVPLEYNRLSTDSVIFCSFEKLWSILYCLSKLRWTSNVDGPFQDTIQNLKRRRLSRVKDWWFFRHQLTTNISMNVFPNQSFPNLRSHLVLPYTKFADMSNICYNVRSELFTMDFWLFWKFSPMNDADSNVTAINNHAKIECSFPSPAKMEILFCLFRTWSFTRFTNHLCTKKSNSVVSFPMMKIWEFATSLELILPSRSDLSRSVSPYVTYGFRCSVEKNFFVIRPNLSYHSQRSFIRLPWSIVASAFHSWEDQART